MCDSREYIENIILTVLLYTAHIVINQPPPLKLTTILSPSAHLHSIDIRVTNDPLQDLVASFLNRDSFSIDNWAKSP